MQDLAFQEYLARVYEKLAVAAAIGVDSEEVLEHLSLALNQGKEEE